jgi:hypothetical protein
MNRTERRREFNRTQRDAFLRVLRQSEVQQQLRERARSLAIHGNSDHQISIELGQSVETVRRWIAEAIQQ